MTLPYLQNWKLSSHPVKRLPLPGSNRL